MKKHIRTFLYTVRIHYEKALWRIHKTEKRKNKIANLYIKYYNHRINTADSETDKGREIIFNSKSEILHWEITKRT